MGYQKRSWACSAERSLLLSFTERSEVRAKRACLSEKNKRPSSAWACRRSLLGNSQAEPSQLRSSRLSLAVKAREGSEQLPLLAWPLPAERQARSAASWQWWADWQLPKAVGCQSAQNERAKWKKSRAGSFAAEPALPNDHLPMPQSVFAKQNYCRIIKSGPAFWFFFLKRINFIK